MKTANLFTMDSTTVSQQSDELRLYASSLYQYHAIHSTPHADVDATAESVAPSISLDSLDIDLSLTLEFPWITPAVPEESTMPGGRHESEEQYNEAKSPSNDQRSSGKAHPYPPNFYEFVAIPAGGHWTAGNITTPDSFSFPSALMALMRAPTTPPSILSPGISENAASGLNPCAIWNQKLSSVFTISKGYNILQFPSTTTFVVRQSLKTDHNLEETKELFVLRCYTDLQAKTDLAEIIKHDAENEDSMARSRSRRRVTEISRHNSWVNSDDEDEAKPDVTRTSWASNHKEKQTDTDGGMTRNSWASNSKDKQTDTTHDTRNSWAISTKTKGKGTVDTLRTSWASSNKDKQTNPSSDTHSSWASSSKTSRTSRTDSIATRSSWASSSDDQARGGPTHNSWAGVLPQNNYRHNSWAEEEIEDKRPAAPSNSNLDGKHSFDLRTVFTPGEQWLDRYLRALRTGKNWDPRDGERCPADKIWGGVAVGNKVEFMELFGGAGMAKDMPTVLINHSFKGKETDLAAKKVLDVEEDFREIEELLACVESGHSGT